MSAAGRSFDDVLALSRDALLRVRGSRVSSANLAARDLFRACGHTSPLEGATLDELWEGASAGGQAALVRARAGGQVLELATSRPAAAGQDYAIRVTRTVDALAAPGVGVLLIDPQTGLVLDASHTATLLLGRAREELVGAPAPLPATAVAADMAALYLALAQDASREDVSEFRSRASDGAALDLDRRRHVHEAPGCRLICDSFRDITDRKADQRRVKHLYAALTDADPLAVIDAETLTYVDLNEAALRVHGMPRDEMLRLGPLGYLRNIGKPTRAEELHAAYAEAIARHPEATTEILDAKSRDGRPMVRQVTRRALKVDGRWLIVVSNRDITERYMATRRLEQLRAAVNEASDMVQVIDPERMEYVEVNEAAARRFGLARETMMERGLLWVGEHLGTWTRESLAELYARVIEQHPASVTDTAALPVAGVQERVVESTRRALRMDGRWLIVSIGRDVTERLRTERELELRMEELSRSNRDLEQFAYVTSHDLSEPLRMVASYTQLLSRRYGAQLDDDGREFMGFVIGGAQRMKRLIDDLLAYSRAGRITQAPRELPLDTALDDALANLSHRIAESGARIDRPGPLPSLAVDKTGMSQVFQNLIANALKFRGEGAPVIRIDARREGAAWTIRVTDNGIGIAPEYFERIFVIFQRLHAREAYEGTGIGLAVCKKIVERHGGTIDVESAPGKGASFRFTLPACAPKGD